MEGEKSVAELEAIIAAVRLVIERGYPSKGIRNNEKCEHGRFGFEDCFGCYDEALLAALDGPLPPAGTGE